MTEQGLIIVTADAGKAGSSRKRSWSSSRGMLSFEVILEQFLALLMQNLISQEFLIFFVPCGFEIS